MSGASWNFAQEFVKLPPGHGRRVFEPGSAAPARNDPDGLAASEALEALTSFPDPDFPTFDTNEVQSLWEVGEVALMEHWGLRGARILSGDNTPPEIVKATVLATAPRSEAGGRLATTLWWDRFTIAAHTSDEGAAASFPAMLNGITPARVADNPALVGWLGEGYASMPASAGVVVSDQGGAAPCLMTPCMGLMHSALGDNLATFLKCPASAQEALDTI